MNIRESEDMEDKTEKIIDFAGSWETTELGTKIIGHDRHRPLQGSFEDALKLLEEYDQENTANLVSRYLGTTIPVEHLPWTNRVLKTTHEVYMKHFKSGKGIVFDDAHREIYARIDDILSWATKPELTYLVHADMLLYLEEHYLNQRDRDRLRSLIPEKEKRAKLFADYMWERGHGNPEDGTLKKWESPILELFAKLLDGLKKLLFADYFVYSLFEDIRCGRIKTSPPRVSRTKKRHAEVSIESEREGCCI